MLCTQNTTLENVTSTIIATRFIIPFEKHLHFFVLLFKRDIFSESQTKCVISSFLLRFEKRKKQKCMTIKLVFRSLTNVSYVYRNNVQWVGLFAMHSSDLSVCLLKTSCLDPSNTLQNHLIVQRVKQRWQMIYIGSTAWCLIIIPSTVGLIMRHSIQICTLNSSRCCN